LVEKNAEVGIKIAQLL